MNEEQELSLLDALQVRIMWVCFATTSAKLDTLGLELTVLAIALPAMDGQMMDLLAR